MIWNMSWRVNLNASLSVWWGHEPNMMPKKSTMRSKCVITSATKVIFCIYHVWRIKIYLILCLKGAGTNERCLIEVLASRTNQQMHDMVAAYKDGAFNDTSTVYCSFFSITDIYNCVYYQPMAETWKRMWLQTLQVTLRRCWLFYSRLVPCTGNVRSSKGHWTEYLQPKYIWNLSYRRFGFLLTLRWCFQGTRDESGVVDADLVEQDAQVWVPKLERRIATLQRILSSS